MATYTIRRAVASGGMTYKAGRTIAAGEVPAGVVAAWLRGGAAAEVEQPVPPDAGPPPVPLMGSTPTPLAAVAPAGEPTEAPPAADLDPVAEEPKPETFHKNPHRPRAK